MRFMAARKPRRCAHQVRLCWSAGATQRRGWAAVAASLRRPALWAGCPALLAPRGDFDNSALGTGPQTRRSRRGVPLQPRCAALLGAAEAQQPPPTRASARTIDARDDSATRRAVAARGARSSRSACLARPWAGGRWRASAAPRSAGARGLRIAARRCVERSLFEHRAQADRAARCRPCEGEFCARPRAPSTGGQSARRDDRRSEAPPGIRPRPCALGPNAATKNGASFWLRSTRPAARPAPRT
jgi:hypothetical protein